MKSKRQEAILELVKKFEIETQEELAEKLGRAGFDNYCFITKAGELDVSTGFCGNLECTVFVGNSTTAYRNNGNAGNGLTVSIHNDTSI